MSYTILEDRFNYQIVNENKQTVASFSAIALSGPVAKSFAEAFVSMQRLGDGTVARPDQKIYVLYDRLDLYVWREEWCEARFHIQQEIVESLASDFLKIRQEEPYPHNISYDFAFSTLEGAKMMIKELKELQRLQKLKDSTNAK